MTYSDTKRIARLDPDDPFARILTALGLEDTAPWREAADAVDALVGREADAQARARVVERECDGVKNERDEARFIITTQKAKIDRLRASIADVEALHAQHLAEYGPAEEAIRGDGLDDLSEEAAAHRHHAATCALAHAVWLLSHSREERERMRRDAFARAGIKCNGGDVCGHLHSDFAPNVCPRDAEEGGR